MDIGEFDFLGVVWFDCGLFLEFGVVITTMTRVVLNNSCDSVFLASARAITADEEDHTNNTDESDDTANDDAGNRTGR